MEPFVEELPEQFDCHEFFKVKVGEDVTHREAHRATAAYYGMIEWADRQYARVIAKLEELAVLDDFAIAFFSDHGEMLGQKGLWEKQQFFDASARVPFFISWPQGLPQGGVVPQNVSLVDLFPTLCDIADVPIPSGLDGRSLVPLIEGRADGWPNEVYSELHHPFNGPSAMIRQDNLKYFRFEGKSWPDQLFDMGRRSRREPQPDRRPGLRRRCEEAPGQTRYLSEVASGRVGRTVMRDRFSVHSVIAKISV